VYTRFVTLRGAPLLTEMMSRRFLFKPRIALRGGDFKVLVLDVEAQPAKEAHICIGNPDQAKPRNQVPAPAWNEQLKFNQGYKGGCNVVAETVLTGQQVKEFSFVELGATLAAVRAPVAQFPKHFFVRDRPADTRHRYAQNQQGDDLFSESGHRGTEIVTVLRSLRPGAVPRQNQVGFSKSQPSGSVRWPW
jgi:hypothetical protein